MVVTVRSLGPQGIAGYEVEVECAIMPGKGTLQLTGQLGDVMEESARAGMSYIRSDSGS